MSTIKTAVTTAVVMAGLGIGGIAGYNNIKNATTPSIIEINKDTVNDINIDAVDKIKFSETQVNDIKQVAEQTVLKVKTSKDIILENDPLIDWELFKKSQKITLFAEARFTVDMNDFNPETDVVYDNTRNKVVIYFPKPTLKEDNIDLKVNESQIQGTKKGNSLQKDIKMTMGDTAKLMENARLQMMEQVMGDKKLQAQAEETFIKQMENMMTAITSASAEKDIIVNIQFK